MSRRATPWAEPPSALCAASSISNCESAEKADGKMAGRGNFAGRRKRRTPGGRRGGSLGVVGSQAGAREPEGEWEPERGGRRGGSLGVVRSQAGAWERERREPGNERWRPWGLLEGGNGPEFDGAGARAADGEGFAV